MLQRKILTLLEKQNLELKEIKKEMEILKSKLSIPSIVKDLPDDCPVLPSKEVEDLIDLEEYLRDEEKFSQVVSSVCVYFRVKRVYYFTN